MFTLANAETSEVAFTTAEQLFLDTIAKLAARHAREGVAIEDAVARGVAEYQASIDGLRKNHDAAVRHVSRKVWAKVHGVGDDAE